MTFYTYPTKTNKNNVYKGGRDVTSTQLCFLKCSQSNHMDWSYKQIVNDVRSGQDNLTTHE